MLPQSQRLHLGEWTVDVVLDEDGDLTLWVKVSGATVLDSGADIADNETTWAARLSAAIRTSTGDAAEVGNADPRSPVATYRCPDHVQPGLTAEADVIGCGHVFEAEPDFEGLVDCPNCGMWFTPELEVEPVVRLSATGEKGGTPGERLGAEDLLDVRRAATSPRRSCVPPSTGD